MKRFVSKLITFILLISIIGISSVLFLNSTIRNKTNFIQKSNPKYVVFGHSHPECALNDSLIYNFSNFSASGEAYFYTNIKARNIIEQNNSIKNVFIQFSYSNVNTETNEWIWADKYLSKRYDEYSPFMSWKEQHVLFKNNSFGFLKYLVNSSKKNLKRLLNQHDHFQDEIGGYRYLDKSSSIFDNQKELNLNSSLLKDKKYSEINLNALIELVNFCLEKEIYVYLIRTPIHDKNPRDVKMNALLKSPNLEKIRNVEFLDFSNFPLLDSDFFDVGHLNYKGAIKFSQWFNTLLQKDLINNKNKQELIEEQLRLLKQGDLQFDL